MAQYTNPYGQQQQQQYYGTTATSNPYATPYAQYAASASPYVGQTAITSQYPQYSTATAAYQATQQMYGAYTPPTTLQAGMTPAAARMPAIQGEAANSLWMGDIDSWMEENFIYSLFAHTGEVVNVKLIRDKQTGVPSNYAFIYFTSQLAAQKVLENFNGQPIPGTSKVFRLNWAQYGVAGDKGKRTAATPDMRRPVAGIPPRPGSHDESISLFVGDLAPEVTDYYLLSTFQYYYPSCYHAKIVIDPKTGLSKGYGFVYFTDDNEKIRALNEMQGYYLSYRPIRLNLATKKGESKPPQYVPGTLQPQYPLATPAAPVAATLNKTETQTLGPADPNNTTVFVGGIDSSVTHDLLKSFFGPYGEIVQVKIPYGKGCAFVEYSTHEAAARVLATFNNSVIIGNSQVRLSWGRPSRPVGAASQGSTSSPTTQNAPPRPQITSQTTSHAQQALLGQTKQEDDSQKATDQYAQEGGQQFGYEYQGYEGGGQEEYVPQQYQAGDYQPGEEGQQATRPITNEDVNQAPKDEPAVEETTEQKTQEEKEQQKVEEDQNESKPEDKEEQQIEGNEAEEGKSEQQAQEAEEKDEEKTVQEESEQNQSEQENNQEENTEDKKRPVEEVNGTEDSDDDDEQASKRRKTEEATT